MVWGEGGYADGSPKVNLIIRKKVKAPPNEWLTDAVVTASPSSSMIMSQRHNREWSSPNLHFTHFPLWMCQMSLMVLG